MINTTLFTNNSEDLLVGTTQAVNTSSDGVFGIMLMLAIFIILFSAMLRWGAREAFSATSFICVGLAIFLRVLEIITDPVLYGCIVLAVIGLVVAVWNMRD